MKVLSSNYAKKLIRAGEAKPVGIEYKDGKFYDVLDRRDKRNVFQFVYVPRNG